MCSGSSCAREKGGGYLRKALPPYRLLHRRNRFPLFRMLGCLWRRLAREEAQRRRQEAREREQDAQRQADAEQERQRAIARDAEERYRQVEAELAAQKARRVLEAEAAKDIQRLRRGVIARRQVQQVKEVRAFVFVCVTAMKYTLCSCLCHAWHGGREWRDVVLCCVALCGDRDHGWNSL